MIDNQHFEQLIHDYMADPLNNHVYAIKGPVDRVLVHHREEGGWQVEFFCEKDPMRPFLLDLTAEDLLGWMWAEQKKARA